MGETCSACDAHKQGPAEEILVQEENGGYEALEVKKEIEKEAQESQTGEKRADLQSMSSKLQKNNAYSKLNKGGIQLEEMPNYSNEISKNKREEFGKFVYEMPHFESAGAEAKGPIEFEERYVYEGQWLNNERNGRGVQLWRGGSIYEGYWKNNVAHGYGRLVHSDGDVYIGEWDNDRANGKGSGRIIQEPIIIYVVRNTMDSGLMISRMDMARRVGQTERFIREST